MFILTTRANGIFGQCGRLKSFNQKATEMRRYKLTVLGINETHWIQAEQ